MTDIRQKLHPIVKNILLECQAKNSFSYDERRSWNLDAHLVMTLTVREVIALASLVSDSTQVVSEQQIRLTPIPQSGTGSKTVTPEVGSSPTESIGTFHEITYGGKTISEVRQIWLDAYHDAQNRGIKNLVRTEEYALEAVLYKTVPRDALGQRETA
jgi:hypothetical protein